MLGNVKDVDVYFFKLCLLNKTMEYKIIYFVLQQEQMKVQYMYLHCIGISGKKSLQNCFMFSV